MNSGTSAYTHNYARSQELAHDSRDLIPEDMCNNCNTHYLLMSDSASGEMGGSSGEKIRCCLQFMILRYVSVTVACVCGCVGVGVWVGVCLGVWVGVCVCVCETGT